jgi:2,4-dienoyl-CoA reductase (NADPH2)
MRRFIQLMNKFYPNLFSNFKLGNLNLTNRIVMGSMHTGLEEESSSFEKLTRFYEERAAGGVGLIITGGFAPNRIGWLVPFSGKLTNDREVKRHRKMTDRVHSAGSKILLQILHAGRYSYHPFAVAPSSIKSPISKFKPWEMSENRIQSTLNDFVRCAQLARDAGYDGVEIMGSEGYLLNQFLAEKSNRRSDQWGGNFENRCRFPLEIVKRIRNKMGPDFVLMFRISMLDLVEKGSTIEETLSLAKKLELAGVTVFNTGIGWHEARVPTIATAVPRATFAWVTQKLKAHIQIPVVAVNRINTPDVAEKLLTDGCCDLVSMARPLLADAQFVNKAFRGAADEINTCIGCNQGCLDLIFQQKRATCLVNPRACYETEMPVKKVLGKKQIAVIGAGPAGLAFAVTAADRGHEVTIFDQAHEIGGQFNFAKIIPGKSEFYETLRYYQKQIELLKINLILGRPVSSADMELKKFDEIIVATGVRPRAIQIPGYDRPEVVSYTDVLSGKVKVGKRVGIIGAGGIGFDVAQFLSHESGETSVEDFLSHWGVSRDEKIRGSLVEKETTKSNRQIFLMQRKEGKLGAGLGKTTGWIHRAELLDSGVEMLSGVNYLKIDDQGLHLTQWEKEKVLKVDHIVICAGQEPENNLANELVSLNHNVHIIGGAFAASELDAKKAILQGTKLGLEI